MEISTVKTIISFQAFVHPIKDAIVSPPKPQENVSTPDSKKSVR